MFNPLQDDLLPILRWKVVPVDKLPKPAAVVTCTHPGQGGLPGDPERRPAEYEMTMHVLKQPSHEERPMPIVGEWIPAGQWDENDGYEYDDTKPAVDLEDETAEGFNGLTRPQFVGIVSGAEYKLENAEDGVTEYALAVVNDKQVVLFEMSKSDLEYLGRQITGLIGNE